MSQALTVREPSSAQLGLMDDDDADALDLPAFLDADPGLAVALEEIARKQHLLEALQAQAMMDMLGRHAREMNACDGMGEVYRVMPAFAWHDIALAQGTYDCFKDRSFNRYLDRKAPETVVKSRAPKSGNGLPLMVGWRRESEPKFSKNYGHKDTKAHSAAGGAAVPAASLRPGLWPESENAQSVRRDAGHDPRDAGATP